MRPAWGWLAAPAAALYLWGIGSSSWFVDEVSTARIAGAGFRSFAHQLRSVEQNPPGYFGVLNIWSHLLGTTSEAWLRLPSAIAAALVVAVVARLAYLIAGGWAAAAAAAVAAASPFSLQYGQQARPYAFSMLLCVLAGLAALEAANRGSRRWLAVCAAAAGASLWVHYFALFVVAPLMLWLMRQPALRRRDRQAAFGVVTLVWVLSLPLAYLQFRHKPTGGVGAYGDLTAGHVTWVIGAPFDGRYGLQPGVLQALGALVVLASFVLLVQARGSSRARWLLAALVLVPNLALVVLAIGGRDVLISRYAAEAVPFVDVAIGVAVARLRGVAGYALALAAIGVALAGLVRSELPGSSYPPTRQVVAVVAADWHRGDVIEDATASFSVQYALQYYAERRLHQVVSIYSGGPLPETGVWLVTARHPPATPAGFVPAGNQHFDGILPLNVELLQPTGRS